MTPTSVREAIGSRLRGSVLEIGPGYQPFPTPEATSVTFADRRIEGGRDANFPELVGRPHGPPADVDLDLDVDGLRAMADASFDAVVASHMVEHLANPVAALTEMHRVLRPGGRLVLLLPDRHHTVDAGRSPTPFDHFLDEYRRGMTEVDEAHIREFCRAMYALPDHHPPEVREWHDPDRLDGGRLALHRRRSIHVHCWDPEEFAALVVGLAATGIVSWDLEALYLREDLDEPGDEFGLVLRRPDADGQLPPADQAAALVRAWSAAVLADRRRDPGRIVVFAHALRHDLADASLDDLAIGQLVDEVGRLREMAADRQSAGDI